MNNDELEQLLKSARVPGREDDYWKDFPRTVTASIRRKAAAERGTQEAPGLRLWLRPVWGIGVAVACMVIAVVLITWKQSDARKPIGALAEEQKYYREIERLFPNQVRAIVFDRQGPHLVLADKAEVPGASPLFVRICGMKGCERVVTFSGQEIQFEGEKYEILADKNGRVMLVGDSRILTEGETSGPITVRSQML